MGDCFVGRSTLLATTSLFQCIHDLRDVVLHHVNISCGGCAVGPDFDITTGNIAFRATFPNPAALLRHGQTGNIVVTTKYPDAQMIPQKATFETLDRRYVFVIGDDGIVKSRPIVVAAELPHAFIIESGLADTDKVLLEGLRKVQDGKHIEVKFEEPAEVFAQLTYHAE